MGSKKTRISAKGRDLKMKRLELGYTQRQFAEVVGITQQQLSMIENGRSGASEETAMAIARRLRCDVDHVFDVRVPYEEEDAADPFRGVVTANGQHVAAN